jgi:hypothetical protein
MRGSSDIRHRRAAKSLPGIRARELLHSCVAVEAGRWPPSSLLTSAPLKPVQNLTLQGSPRNPVASWQCTNYKVGTSRPGGHHTVSDRPQPTRNEVAGDGVADGLRDYEANSRRLGLTALRDVQKRVRSTNPTTRSYRGAEVACCHYPICSLEHDAVDAVFGLRRELGATLAAAGGQDRPAGASAHE